MKMKKKKNENGKKLKLSKRKMGKNNNVKIAKKLNFGTKITILDLILDILARKFKYLSLITNLRFLLFFCNKKARKNC